MALVYNELQYILKNQVKKNCLRGNNPHRNFNIQLFNENLLSLIIPTQRILGYKVTILIVCSSYSGVIIPYMKTLIGIDKWDVYIGT